MAFPGGGSSRRRDSSGRWAHRRVYLSLEDIAILQELQAPGETLGRTLRRILREALARKPVDEALRGLEARLARIEAAGFAAGAVAGRPAADDTAAVQRVMATWRARLDDGDEPQG